MLVCDCGTNSIHYIEHHAIKLDLDGHDDQMYSIASHVSNQPYIVCAVMLHELVFQLKHLNRKYNDQLNIK